MLAPAFVSVPVPSRNLDLLNAECHHSGLRPGVSSATIENRLKQNVCELRRSALDSFKRPVINDKRRRNFCTKAKVAEENVGTSGSSTTLNSSGNSVQSGLENSYKLLDTVEGSPKGQRSRTIRLLIAGGGIGGLVLALAAKKRGMDVKVFERDMSAIRGEGQYRGPIQIQSNALAALEAIDGDVAERIMDKGCVTGDRINGLCDGLSGSWYCKFDTYSPAVKRGLPVTRVISRMTLQTVLAEAVGEDILNNGCNVVDYEDDGSKVTVLLEDGRRFEGDILVGADGIRSKVRNKLLGPSEAIYSDYTCYTGIADFEPADIETVGYRVFLGSKQYFVSSDVGAGKMQWYAFYKEPAGGTDAPGKRKERLFKLFGNWCDGVVDLLLATPEENILRRDIYDRRPILSWGKGRVTLLGDSAHAMQPNMGQGGCMAIEDGFQLALDLSKAMDKVQQNQFVDIPSVLKRQKLHDDIVLSKGEFSSDEIEITDVERYEGERRLRVGAIHGMARMAAIMASTYKAYFGDGLGPLSVLRNFKIPHPGRVGGKFFVSVGMPLMLSWVLGGNTLALEGRAPSCRIEDKADGNLKKWFLDNDALERATLADWYLLPIDERMPAGTESIHGKTVRIGGVNSRPVIIGSEPCEDPETDSAVISLPNVAPRHARVHNSDGAFFLTDLKSQSGTSITNIEGERYCVPCSHPVRIRQGDVIEFGPGREAAFRVKLRKPPKSAANDSASAVSA